MSGSVMSVLGEVAAESLGIVSMHEHLFSNLFPEMRRDGVLNDYELAVEEVGRFRDAGGQTIVEVTTVELDRSPELLCRLAAETGLNVVMSTGHYRDPYLDRGWFDRNDHVAIGEQLIDEIVNGVIAGSAGHVRPGIIAEIGCRLDYISAAEERSFRAAAYAHQRTGLTISTHAVTWPVGTIQLDLLESCGVDPRRVIVGHCDTVSRPGYRLDLARRGAYVQFDTIRGGTDDWGLDQRLRGVLELAEAGHLEQILLAQDICAVPMLTVHGGGGYGFILHDFLPRLREAGINDAEVHTLLIENPRRALTGDLPA